MTAYPLSRSVDAGRRRRQRTHRAAAGQDQRPKLGRNRRPGTADREENRARSGQGQARTDYARVGGVGAAPPTPRSRRTSPDAPKPETRVVVFGDSDFASNSALGIEGNRDIFMNTVGWLSQQENLISIRAEGTRRSPSDADGDAAEQHLTWLSSAHRAGLDFRHRRLQLVAETVGHARIEIHARAAGRPDRTRRVHLLRRREEVRYDDARSRRSCSPSLEAAKIDELKVKSESGDVTTLKKDGGAWKIVAPIAVPAAETDATSLANALGDIEIVRVVDENPTDVKTYGLDAPQHRCRIQVGRRQDRRTPVRRRQDRDRRQPATPDATIRSASC